MNDLCDIQYSANRVMNYINDDARFIYADKIESIKDPAVLGEYIMECIKNGFPAKYIAYNAWLLSHRSIRGNGMSFKPIWGQTRAIFIPPNKDIIYKIALSSAGMFGNKTEAIYNTSVYFKNSFLDEWITDPFSVEMIKDVDKSVVMGPHMIESPVLGAISPKELSGGVKTLILIHKDKTKIFNASTCGDNCAKWLLRLGEMDDVLINLRHIMDFGNGEFEIEILNTHQIVRNMKELIDIAVQLI